MYLMRVITQMCNPLLGEMLRRCCRASIAQYVLGVAQNLYDHYEDQEIFIYFTMY